MPPFRFLFSLNHSSWVVVSCDLPVVGVVGTALTCHGFTTSFTMYISGLTLLFHSPAGLFSSFYLNSILLKQAEWLCPQALTGWGSGLGLSILILSHLDKVNECKKFYTGKKCSVNKCNLFIQYFLQMQKRDFKKKKDHKKDWYTEKIIKLKQMFHVQGFISSCLVCSFHKLSHWQVMSRDMVLRNTYVWGSGSW